jgi:2,3-dihydro-2,3-dihydroxybenzoate dehydrogenase
VVDEDFVGRVALVTGASGGIGAAVVRVLAESGARVAAVDVNDAELAAQVRRLRDKELDVTAFPADVSSSESVVATVDRVERELGPIDYLANVAGVLRPGLVLSTSDDDWNLTFAVNVRGVFNTSRAVAERMVRRRGGAIVTVASNAAAVPRVGMAAYAASKAAATSFTKSLGLEVARYGVRCNVVAPGSTDTDMLRALWTDDSGPAKTLEGDAGAFRVGIPLGRIATPEDVAGTVLFLLSSQARHITLQAIQVDGGAALGA